MQQKLKPINEQVVVVMGASSGIGRETAKRFAARGAKVVVSARTDEGLESLVEEITQAGGEATAFPADVTEFAQVKAVADRTVERYGRIDTWAHVAGVAIYGIFDETATGGVQAGDRYGSHRAWHMARWPRCRI